MKTQLEKTFFRVTFAGGQEANFFERHEAENFWSGICDSQKEKMESVKPFGKTEIYSEEKIKIKGGN